MATLTLEPVAGPVSQEFGANAHFSWQPWGHLGRDYAVVVGSSCFALGPGVVMFADWGQNMPKTLADKYIQTYGSPASGIVVILAHEGAERGDPRGWFSMYAHLSATHLNPGISVIRGQVVGRSGNTGNSTGPHLHFEVFTRPNWTPPFGRYDPRLQIKAQNDEAAALSLTPSNPMERVTGPQGAQEFSGPTATEAGKKRYFGPGLALTMKGYVVGERIGGQNLWYVGMSGGYFHCSAFTTAVVGALKNLTPPVAPAVSNVRSTGAAVAVHRKYPFLGAERLPNLKPSTGYVIDAYCTDGDEWNGTRIWFRLVSGKGWSHSKLFTSQDLTGLRKVAAPRPPVTSLEPSKPPVVQTPTETAPAPYVFNRLFPMVTKVVPAHRENFQVGNFPARPTHLAIHQFDHPDRKPTLAGVDSWFQTAASKRATADGSPSTPSSAQFACSAPNFHQYVKVDLQGGGDRAYHAGAIGNDYIAIEVPPNPDDATIEMVKEFQRQWHKATGYWLILTDHKSIPGNSTTCGTHIPLDRFRVTPDPTPMPPDPAPVVDSRVELLTGFVNHIKTEIPTYLQNRK